MVQLVESEPDQMGGEREWRSEMEEDGSVNTKDRKEDYCREETHAILKIQKQCF